MSWSEDEFVDSSDTVRWKHSKCLTFELCQRAHFSSFTITELTVLVAAIYSISFCQESFNLEPKRVKSCQSWYSVITELSVKRLQINRIHSVCRLLVSKRKFGRIANKLSVKWSGGLDQSLFQMCILASTLHHINIWHCWRYFWVKKNSVFCDIFEMYLFRALHYLLSSVITWTQNQAKLKIL